jgi:GTP-dependent dephospho-CoA kinase
MPPGGMPSASSEPRIAWILPDSLRPAFQQPYGPVWSGPRVATEIRKLGQFATCGDLVTSRAIAIGRVPFIGVVDYKTQRHETIDANAFAPLAAVRHRRVWNPAGMISDELRQAVGELVELGGGLLEVDGEEDLAVMPLIERLPVGASVLYGIPGEGVCQLSVDAAAKARVAALFQQMPHQTIQEGMST